LKPGNKPIPTQPKSPNVSQSFPPPNYVAPTIVQQQQQQQITPNTIINDLGEIESALHVDDEETEIVDDAAEVVDEATEIVDEGGDMNVEPTDPDESTTPIDKANTPKSNRTRIIEKGNEYIERFKNLMSPSRRANASSGKGNKEGEEKGLDTSQINKAMKKYPSYLSTIPRDYIPKLLPYVHPDKVVSFIMNTRPHTEIGEHWVAVYIDPAKSKSVEYYNSFGEPCPPDILKGIKKIVDKMKPDTYLKFKENRIKQQSSSSSNCGYFAMAFLIDRYRNKPFPECTGYSDIVNSEKNIEKLKKTFPTFKYI
jgi:hypothetical protein